MNCFQRKQDEDLHSVCRINKFDIKFWLVSNGNSKYIVNGFSHSRKDERREFSVLKFFTSVSLTTKFLAKKAALVGTIRGNGRKLPKLATQTKDNMNRFSTTLYRSNNCTLTNYKTKPNIKILIFN